MEMILDDPRLQGGFGAAGNLKQKGYEGNSFSAAAKNFPGGHSAYAGHQPVPPFLWLEGFPRKCAAWFVRRVRPPILP